MRYAAVMVCLLLLGAGCGPKAPPATAGPPAPTRFRLAIAGEFETTLPEAPSGTLALALEIRQEQARVFRDGSLGSLVVFEAASGTLSRAGGAAEAVPLELAGRSIELRTFDDGELLDVSLIEHLIGFGRYGDVFDLILPVLTPAPPALRSEREVVGRAMHWPVHLSQQHGLKNTLWAQWRLLDSDREGWTLQYSGPWEGRGANFSAAAPDARLQIAVKGEGSGEVRVSAAGQVERHSFAWRRTVEQRFPAGTVVQTQRFSGVLERQP